MKDKIINKKNIIITVIYILCIACIMKISFKYNNISLAFDIDNNEYNVTMMSDESNTELNKDTYKGGDIRFRLDPDYYDSNEIYLTSNEELGDNVDKIKIYYGKYSKSDTLIAEINISDNDVISVNNAQIINSNVISKINSTINNNKPLRNKYIKWVSIAYIVAMFLMNIKIKETKKAQYKKVAAVVIIGHIIYALLDEFIKRYHLHNTSIWWQEALTISYILLWVVIILSCYKELRINSKIIVRALYVIMICYTVFQGLFYMKYIQDTPDEIAHISYIAYLEESNKIIPDYKEMNLLNDKVSGSYFNKGTINYLGHPPLYYQIMRLCRGITATDSGNFIIHEFRLRVFSFAIAMIGVLILFYIGYTRIDKKIPSLHMLYISIIIGVPMYVFNISGVNNDTLTLVASAIWFLGILRFTEEKRDLGTYFLIAIGIVLATFGKLTAGLLLGMASVLFIFWYMIKNKDIKVLLNKKFVLTLPIYIVVAVYFVYIYMKYGSFQPSLQVLDFDYFKSTTFYTNFADRAIMSSQKYFKYYWSHFFSSWTSVATHARGTLVKYANYFAMHRIIYILILFAPIILVFIKKTKKVMALLSLYVTFVFVALLQYNSAYNAFMFKSGYLGGFGSRYYLCILGILSYSIVYILQSLYNKKKTDEIMDLECLEESKSIFYPYRSFVNSICIVLSVLLLYSSFIYYLLVKVYN